MMKKVLYLFLISHIFAYSATNFNFTEQLVILYKILDPLTVVVDTPEKMVVRQGNSSFLYSEATSSRKPLEVQIQAPFNVRDEILDRLYGTATLKFQNNGEFEMIETTNSSETIEGKGFFTALGEDSTEMVLPLYGGTLPANRYEARTSVDVRFNKKNEEMLIGVYKGVLYLDVTYGE